MIVSRSPLGILLIGWWLLSSSASWALAAEGTAIAPGVRRALVVVLDAQGRETATVVTAEGDTVHGFVVRRIVRDQVSFERDGQVHTVAVGSDRPATSARIRPDVSYEGSKERTAEFGPPPANLDDIQKGSSLLFEQLKANPEFQRAVEALRSRALERLQAPVPRVPVE